MAINLDKPHRWKQDIRLSVDMYNEWFLRFAPEAFRSQRIRATDWVWEHRIDDLAALDLL